MRVSRILTVAALAALLAAPLVGCAAGDRAPVLPLPQGFTLELPQSGGRFLLYQGDELRVRLPANPEAGYRWSMIIDADGGEPLKLAEEPAYEADAGKAGRGGSAVWHFRAEGVGGGRLYFTYRSPQDKGGPPARTVIYYFRVM